MRWGCGLLELGFAALAACCLSVRFRGFPKELWQDAYSIGDSHHRHKGKPGVPEQLLLASSVRARLERLAESGWEQDAPGSPGSSSKTPALGT